MTAPRLQLDHVVVVLSTLDEATARFRQAGFTVTPGGFHRGLPTSNALVGFSDGTYLELLVPNDPYFRAESRFMKAKGEWGPFLKGLSAVGRRFIPTLVRDEGVTDWALRGDDLGRRAAAVRALGVKVAGPVGMSRTLSDRTVLEWDLLLPESHLHPFWITDKTARERRVPGGDAATHANGAAGIAAVRVRTASVPTAALALGEGLGTVPRVRAGMTTLEFERFRVEVIEGEPEGACGVELTGCSALPDVVTTLGVTS